MKKGLFTFLLTCILAVMSLSAQVENPATWTFSRTDLGKGEYELTMKAILEPGMESVFHVYAGRRTFGHYFDVE